jgi:hypothetical protein
MCAIHLATTLVDAERNTTHHRCARNRLYVVALGHRAWASPVAVCPPCFPGPEVPLQWTKAREVLQVARTTSKDKGAQANRRQPRDALPAAITPQLATLASRGPASGEWTYEIKFDGYRFLARVEDSQDVRLFTRNQHDWTARLPQQAQALITSDSIVPGWTARWFF